MEHTAFRVVLSHPNFFELFDYLSYVDLLSLAYAVYPIHSGFGKRLPKFRDIVDRMLRRFDIQTESFWLALQKSEAIIHGSFLLHCLLEPLAMKTYSDIFHERSDIDILESGSSMKQEVCPTCLRKLYEIKFPGDTKTPVKKMLPRLLGTSKEMHHNKVIKQLKELVPIDKRPFHIQSRHIDTNPISSFLCYFGTPLPESSDNYRLPFERRLVWKMSKIKFDQITVSTWVVSHTPGLVLASAKKWLMSQADFDYSKICFDGNKLLIINRRALIKRTSDFPRFINRDEDFDKCWSRAGEEEYKGFTINFSKEVVARRNKIDLEAAKRAERIRCMQHDRMNIYRWKGN